MSDDFDLAHDKLPDQPMTIGGDKSAAAWHPGNGPEVPYADLISRLDWYKAKLERVRQGVNSPSTIAAVEADVLFYEGILAALGDTVPRAEYRKANTDWRNGMLHVEAERDALAAQLAELHAMHKAKHGENDSGPYIICDYDKTRWPCRTQIILATAPAVSLALHDAEVKAQALDEFREEVLGQAGHLTEAGYYSGVASWPDSRASAYSTAIDEVEALATARAAAIRADAN